MNAREQDLRLEVANLKAKLKEAEVERDLANEAIEAVLKSTGSLSLTILALEYDAMKKALGKVGEAQRTES